LAEKSRDAFRTISEVAEWLDVPTHVLRFWESRFAQIKPVKRAGGRRYYRPSDMRVIGGVKVLLHDQGMTIRGVQKLFREEGVKHVSSFSPELYDEGEDLLDAAPLDAGALERAARPAPAARTTRSAEPETIDLPEPEPEVAREETGPVFRTRSRPAFSAEPEPLSETIVEEPDLEPSASDADEPDLSILPDAEETAAPEREPEPTPLVANAPETDPADDDEAHATGPSRAARLRKVPRGALRAEKTRIEAVVARLKTVLDRSA